MEHYNLYNSLNLPADISAADAHQEIKRRLDSGEATNPGGIDELNVALAILGEPQRKDVYDARLRDQNPDNLVTISVLRQLAQMPVGAWNPPQPGQQIPEPTQEIMQPGQQAPQPGQQAPQPGQQAPQLGQQAPQLGQQAPQPGQQVPQPGQQAPQLGQQVPQPGQQAPRGQKPGDSFVDQVKTVGQHTVAAATSTVTEQTNHLRAEYKNSSLKVIIATMVGVAAVTFLVVGLVSNVTGESRNERKAVKITKSILKAKSSAEVTEIIENSWPDKVKENMDDSFDVDDITAGEFTGAKSYFDADKPKVLGVHKVFSGDETAQLFSSGSGLSQSEVDEFADLQPDDFEGTYAVFISDDNDELSGEILFLKVDGKFIPVSIDRDNDWD